VKDAEFIYSLYVQANPVPDPDLLPLDGDEAVLLISKRSPDMITEERVESPKPTPPRRKRLAAALGAAAVLIAAIAAVAILVNGGSVPVAAADANPVVVFDGTSCSYEGPTRIEEGSVEFTMTNSGTESFGFVSWRMAVDPQALEYELERTPIGTDMDARGEPMPVGVPGFSWYTDTGATSSAVSMLIPGTYLFDCTIGNPPEHVWRVAQVEVVPSG
jgi:hypothetical protein